MKAAFFQAAIAKGGAAAQGIREIFSGEWKKWESSI
jgi:hypothetical protein